MRVIALGALLAFLFSTGANAQRPADMPIPADDRAQIIASVADKIETHYFDAGAGRTIARQLRGEARAGAFDRITSALELTDVVGSRLSQLGKKDAHLGFGYSAKPTPIGQVDTEQDFQTEALSVARDGYGIANVSRLEGNLGYLKLTRFHHPGQAATGVASAMTLLHGTDALIIDLRGSGGGSPYMVSHLISYFLPSEPVALFTLRPQDPSRSEQYWSLATLPGPRYLRPPHYGAKPIYILVDKVTRSAAEGFAQHMQARGLATIVGRKTQGAAHVAIWHRVHPNFAVQIPQFVVRDALRPFDWEGVGITPDIETDPANALEVARQHATARISTKSSR